MEAGVLVALAGVRHGARVEEIMTALVIFSFGLPEVRLTEKKVSMEMVLTAERLTG